MKNLKCLFANVFASVSRFLNEDIGSLKVVGEREQSEVNAKPAELPMKEPQEILPEVEEKMALPEAEKEEIRAEAQAAREEVEDLLKGEIKKAA